jgi:hypothetical protein
VYRTYWQYQEANKRDLAPKDILVLSWINFSSILMSLVSEQVEYKNLSELLVAQGSTELSLFVEDQLVLLWTSMLEQFSILHEELEYLIAEVMQRLVKVSSYCTLNSIYRGRGHI